MMLVQVDSVFNFMILLLFVKCTAVETLIPTDCVLPYFPRNYVAYHLGESQSIDIDGKLEEMSWKEVAWTEEFVDIQGANWPKPRFSTHAKMRWDQKYLYIGAFIQETDVWANQTKHDSVVFLDNDFEVFMDPNGDTHWYKEFEINAINTTWDLELNKPYLNGGTPNSSWEMPNMRSAIYVDGPINNPNIKDRFWSVELALPFQDIVVHNPGATAPPKDKSQWRINFSRVEWHVKNVKGHYEKVPHTPEDNWVWSPQHAINMHLPERWGFVQFSNEVVNKTHFTKPSSWPVISALVMLYDAEKEFFAVNGYFTSNVTQLEIPEPVRIGQCPYSIGVEVLKTYSFEAIAKPLDKELPIGHIRDDRLIWFTSRENIEI